MGPGQVSASPHPRWGVFVQDGLQLSRLMRNEKCTVLFIALVFFTAEKLRKNKQISYTLTPRSESTLQGNVKAKKERKFLLC